MSNHTYATPLLIGIQALLMSVDEFVYHRARGLSRWEALGHPLDSFLFFLAVCIQAYLPFNGVSQNLFFVAAVASTLAITKDEWVHARNCCGGEQWLHALLFIIHPSVLICLYVLWGIKQSIWLRLALPIPVFGFMLYQIWFWNLRGEFIGETKISTTDK